MQIFFTNLHMAVSGSEAGNRQDVMLTQKIRMFSKINRWDPQDTKVSFYCPRS